MLRLVSLPSHLRLLVLSYCPNTSRGSGMTVHHTFRRSQYTTTSGFQSLKGNRLPTRLWSHLAWLIPVTGGVAFCLSPGEQIHVASVFSSPTLIPCTEHDFSLPTRGPIIGSPAEPHMPIISRILSLLREHIWEPLLTAGRFTHLFCLFIPVIMTMPMLLVGKSERRYKGDRWGAIWWYEFLVRRMQAAGPTFIKVHILFSYLSFTIYHSHSSACTMGCVARRSLPFVTLREDGRLTLTRQASFTDSHQRGC